MPQTQKLYQILEKAEIQTKIAVEIQDWILDTIDEKRIQSMIQIDESKISPVQQEIRALSVRMDEQFKFVDERFQLMDEKFNLIDQKFDSLRFEMNARFTSLEKRLDATNFSIRLLGVPIVGATIGGLGIIFLQIYERLQ
jgi:hypothetical protein